MSRKGKRADCPICEGRLETSIVDEGEWYCDHCGLTLKKDEMIKKCPSCDISSKLLGVHFYCEHCGYYQKDKWRAVVNQHSVSPVLGSIFFGVLALAVFGILCFVVGFVNYLLLLLTSAVTGISLVFLTNHFQLKKTRLRSVPGKVKTVRALWERDPRQRIEAVFANDPDPEIRKSVLPYFKDDIEKLKTIFLTDRSPVVRCEALKFIADHDLLWELMKTENQQEVARSVINKLDINETEIGELLHKDLADIYKLELISRIRDQRLLAELQKIYTTEKLQKAVESQLDERQGELVYDRFESARAKGMTLEKMLDLLGEDCSSPVKERMIRRVEDINLLYALKGTDFYTQFKKAIDSQIESVDRANEARYQAMAASYGKTTGYTSKKCSACGKEVSVAAAAGQRCPHCGAYWSYEQSLN
jgi:rubrerythrin